MIRGESGGGDPDAPTRAHYARRYETRDDDGSPGDEQCILVKLNLTALIRGREHTCTHVHTWTRACGSVRVSKDESASAKLAQFTLDAMRIYELQKANQRRASN